MANLGFFPFYNRPGRCYPKKMTGTSSTGMVVMNDTANTNASDEVKKTTGAGVVGIDGVIVTPQGDPNNSGLFIAGNVVDVAYEGVVPVLFDALTVITRGLTIISGATAGTAKVLAAEGKPYDVIGYAEEDKTIGATADLCSVRLNIFRVQA